MKFELHKETIILRGLTSTEDKMVDGSELQNLPPSGGILLKMLLAENKSP